MSGEVVLLTGPPGAGKTTVSALVATDAVRPTVHVTTDQFFTAIRTGFVAPYLPGSARQNEVVVDAIAAAVAVYARGGYDVIVDGVIGPWFLPPYQAVAARDGFALTYVVLRPDLETTLARASERTGEALKDTEAITGLYRAFTDLGDLEAHVLDTSGLDAARSADRVRQAVAEGSYRLSAGKAGHPSPTT